MITRRNNLNTHQPEITAQACFAAMQRHAQGPALGLARPIHDAAASAPPRSAAARGANPPGGTPPGDVLYGATAIARFIFGDGDKRTRRRVYNLWAYYRDREEKAGFFKLKGALCLSKSQWRGFHGLG